MGKPLTLINEIPRNLNSIYGDENRLQQILYNLIGNAIKFTNQGQVTISAKQKKDQLKISVSDTGSGIPEEHYDLIFQSFQQHQHPGARTSEGTGLGLSITKKLVKLHQGEIWVESKLGQGSTFYFTLPLADEKSTLQTAPKPEKPKEIAHTYPIHKAFPITPETEIN